MDKDEWKAAMRQIGAALAKQRREASEALFRFSNGKGISPPSRS